MKRIITSTIATIALLAAAPAAGAHERIRVHVTGHMQPGEAGCTGYPTDRACRGAIVTLYVDGFPVADHPVRCPSPRRLHVAGVAHHRADVFACSRFYHWPMP